MTGIVSIKNVPDDVKIKKAKHYLRKAQLIQTRLTYKEERLAELRAVAESTSAPLKPDKVQSSGPKSLLEETMIKYLDLERKLKSQHLEMIAEKSRIEDTLLQLDDPREIKVLHTRYIECMDWEDIFDLFEDDFNTLRRTTLRLHRQALLHIYDIIAATDPDYLTEGGGA